MLQLNIKCQGKIAEEVSATLEALGALAITVTDQFDDAIFEPEAGSNPIWPHVVIHALFADEHRPAALIETLTMHHAPQELVMSSEVVPEQDWHQAMQQSLQPQQFGARLWICPSWHSAPQEDAIQVILDPGLAFGTGSHATTALCLLWLENNDLGQKVVIDYGCGSGILAIAALKLGAAHAYAIDIDEQALLSTANNASHNQINPTALTIGTPDLLPSAADVLVANILLNPLLALKSHFHSLMKANARLVISGVLVKQIDEVIDAYQSHFTHSVTRTREDWALLEFHSNALNDSGT